MEEQQLQMQAYMGQLQQISKYLEDLETQKEQMELTVEALQELKKVKKGTKILAPLSNGIFVESTIEDTENLIVNTGAGIATKKDINETIEDLIKELENLSKHVQMMEKQKIQLTRIIEIIANQKQIRSEE